MIRTNPSDITATLNLPRTIRIDNAATAIRAIAAIGVLDGNESTKKNGKGYSNDQSSLNTHPQPFLNHFHNYAPLFGRFTSNMFNVFLRISENLGSNL
jgi:hypothetical protein